LPPSKLECLFKAGK